jgi:hypothetical protein
MKKNAIPMDCTIYGIYFFIPAAILFTGLYNGSDQPTHSGVSLLIFLFMSLVGGLIKRFRDKHKS